MLALGIAAHSQAFKASYTYDANGNRTLATIIWLSTSLKSDTLSTIDLETLQNTSLTGDTLVFPIQGYINSSIDSIGKTKISIYPNPTHGILLIQLTGFDIANNVANIVVYDINGIKILQKSSISQLNSIDLLSRPAGTYILTIQLGTLSKTYTIIKN